MILAGPASTRGGAGVMTTIVTSALADRSLSVAVNRSTYVPAAEKLAVVLSALTLPNMTVPEPLNFDHVTVSVLPAGRPSSAAVPLRLAEAGSVTVWLEPALTVGA